jgi:hypothetical protein
VLVSLAIGATVGGLLLIHAPIYAPVLPLVITLGVVLMAASIFRYDEEAQSREGRSQWRSDAPVR